MALSKKFQQDLPEHEDDKDKNEKEIDKNHDENDENINLNGFENTVTYTMTCLLCSQCGSQCCHIPRKSLTMERGILC